MLGGDCTVGVGTLAGHLPDEGRVGLVYLDLHADLNTPETVIDGALDWMGVAHLLGEPSATPGLRDFGPRTPLLDDDQIVLLGFDAAQATASERAASSAAGSRSCPCTSVAADPAAAAAALSALEGCDRLVVHFDVDVIDFTDAPLSENTGRNIGLTQDQACAALGAVLADPRVRGAHDHRAQPAPRRRGRHDADDLRREPGRRARHVPRSHPRLLAAHA